MKKIACCIFSHDVTKGMKSYGPVGLLRANNKSKELLFSTIDNLRKKINNIFVILGFEKDIIIKKIDEYSLTKKINTITNSKYADSNHGYAFKIAVNKIVESHGDDLHGILFLNSNTLVKNIPNFTKNKSCIFVDKKTSKNKYTLGCFIEKNLLRYIFYNLGDYLWTEVVYISMADIKKMQKLFDTIYYDNMFMFEMINLAIERQQIDFETINLDRSSDLIRINGIKDKTKIK